MDEKDTQNNYQELFNLPNVIDAADKLFDIVKKRK